MEGLLALPIVSKLISESDIKRPKDALVRPFFMGNKLHKPALTEVSIKRRLENEDKFCKYCFMCDEHDFVCRLSGWKEFMP